MGMMQSLSWSKPAEPEPVNKGTIFEGVKLPEPEPFITVDELTSSGKLQIGDPIEFEDKVLRHWALYAGEEEPYDEKGKLIPIVVHFFSLNGAPHEVRYDALETAACGKRCRINKKYDLVLPPRSGEEIMRAAYYMIGKKDYNIVSNNCEHFVTGCRYGFFVSEQVQEAYNSYGKQFEILTAAVSSGFSTATYSMVKTSCWDSTERTAARAEIGDLIEFKNTIIVHWAIFAGCEGQDPMVIHLWKLGGDSRHRVGSGSKKLTFQVRYDKMEFVAEGRKSRVNNKYDDRVGHYSGDETLKRAHKCYKEDSQNEHPEYSVISYNCEHFASWCRNGKALSDQANELKDLEKRLYLI